MKKSPACASRSSHRSDRLPSANPEWAAAYRRALRQYGSKAQAERVAWGAVYQEHPSRPTLPGDSPELVAVTRPTISRRNRARPLTVRGRKRT